MKRITFSIIVVSLNAGEKLRRTVQSILEQSYPHFEVIVKDGMSTDGSVDRLPQDERIRIVRQRDTGIYDAMNQATALADGDYLLYLNCGDYFYHEKVLEKAGAWIGTDRAASEIYYGDIYNRSVDTRIVSDPHITAFTCYRNVPCHQACFYARQLMRKRKYNPKYRVRADYDHFLGCYFEDGVRPVSMHFIIVSYEAGGFSETAENARRSAREHKAITGKYMSAGQLFLFRMLMLLSMAPLRTRIAGSRRFSGIYQKIKAAIYQKRG